MSDLALRIVEAPCVTPGCGKIMYEHECPHIVEALKAERDEWKARANKSMLLHHDLKADYRNLAAACAAMREAIKGLVLLPCSCHGAYATSCDGCRSAESWQKVISADAGREFLQRLERAEAGSKEFEDNLFKVGLEKEAAEAHLERLKEGNKNLAIECSSRWDKLQDAEARVKELERERNFLREYEEKAVAKIKSLTAEAEASRELWITAQNACAKHARRADALESVAVALKQILDSKTTILVRRHRAEALAALVEAALKPQTVSALAGEL